MSRYIANIRKSKDKSDIYPTPAWVTEKLIDNVKFDGSVTEPVCGYGHMAEVLKKYYKVHAYDINDLGYGEVKNFLEDSRTYDNIITNPPYSCTQEFIEHALNHATGKVAMLCRIEFLSSQKRQDFFQKNLPSKILILGRRLKNWDSEKKDFVGDTSAFSHVWIVWDCSRKVEQTIVRWI